MGTMNWSGFHDRIVTVELDEELDHYRLLAYLQQVDHRYRERKLYPHLDQLRTRLLQLTGLRDRKAALNAMLPRELTGIDLEHHELKRAELNDDDALRTIDAMMDRAIPALQRMLEMGIGLREELAGSIRFSPVGLIPLNTHEGYLLLRQGRETVAYVYDQPLLRQALPGHLILRTTYVTTFSVGLACTYEQMKAQLVRNMTSMPNPATFVFESDITLPRVETFMPLAKQLVHEAIARQGT